MRTFIFTTFLLIANNLHAADSVRALINECWKGHDHPEMSECVAGRASEARNRLLSVQAVVLKAINAIDENRYEAGFPTYKHDAKMMFFRGNELFEQYRSTQCSYLAAVTSTGNGAGHFRLACEASLDTERADALEASLVWLS